MAAKTERRIPQRKTIIEKTIKAMKELGTYRPQYRQVIEIYADMVYQYNYLSREFESSGFQVVVPTERSGGKKNPVLVSLENLRKDIGTYSDKLKLSPKSCEPETEKPNDQPSVFAALMQKRGAG